jgi:hypothetical protein
MFETLKDYIESTPITNFTRKYHAGVDNINVMPLENILLDDEVSALNKIFAMEYKRDVDQYRTQCTLHHSDDTYKELNKLVDVVQTKFDLELSNHVDARMWHDKEGFYFNPHTDNTAVEISVQIYLNNDAPEYCGTSYFFNGLEKYDNFVNIWTSPYKKGSGYLLINTDTEVHAMCHRVPPGCSRTSLYLNFRRK